MEKQWYNDTIKSIKKENMWIHPPSKSEDFERVGDIVENWDSSEYCNKIGYNLD